MTTATLTPSLLTLDPDVIPAPMHTYLSRVEGTVYDSLADQATTFALMFPSPVDEDEMDHVASLVGYAWAVHGDRTRTGEVADAWIVWPDDRTAVFTTRFDLRQGRSRTRGQAAQDFCAAVAEYIDSGTPPRKRDGNQVAAPLGWSTSDEVTFYLG